jgi:uncharacterized protein
MKIAIIGATGFVGSHLVKEALSRNISVIAIARDTTKLETSNALLVKKNINVEDESSLADAVKGVDVVVSAFNAGWINPNIYEDFIAGAKHIEAAIEKSGVKRLIVIGGAGSLYINRQQLVDGPNFPENIKPGATAARDYFNLLKENSQLDWTFFSPAIEMHPGITIGRTGKYRLGKDEPVFDENGKCVLSVEDLSVAILNEVANAKFIKQRFTAAY